MKKSFSTLIYFLFVSNVLSLVKRQTEDSETTNSFKCEKVRTDRKEICYDEKFWQDNPASYCSRIGKVATSVNFFEEDQCEKTDFYRRVEFLCCLEKGVDSESESAQEDKNIDLNEPLTLREAESFFDENSFQEKYPIRSRPIFNEGFTQVKSEHQRFTDEKSNFQRKYQEKIQDLKEYWAEEFEKIKNLQQTDPDLALQKHRETEEKLRQNYEKLCESAKNERKRINEEHETNLDKFLAIATNQTRSALDAQWKKTPFKCGELQKLMKNYVEILLRDRIHLVNRYERLRVVDKDRAEKIKDKILQRLKTIEQNLRKTLEIQNGCKTNQEIIRRELMKIIDDYREVNQAANILLEQNQIKIEVPETNDVDFATTVNQRIKLLPEKFETPDSEETQKEKNRTKSMLTSIFATNFVNVMIFGVALMSAFLLLILVLLKKKKSRTNRFVAEIDQKTEKKKSLENFQAEGFENPTYKFFEKQSLII